MARGGYPSNQSMYSLFTDSTQVPTRRDHDTMKLMVVGDDGVGKTCFLLKWADGGFNTTHIPTVGVDYKDRVIQFNKKEEYVVEIWDTAGNEAFDRVTTPIYDHMEGIIVMFDVGSLPSFMSLDKWMAKIKEHTKNVPIVVVGNKSDTDGCNRAVKKTKAQVYAKERGLQYFESSSYFGSQVDEAVNELIRLALLRRKELMLVKKHLEKMEKRPRSKERSMTAGDEKSKKSQSRFSRGRESTTARGRSQKNSRSLSKSRVSQTKGRRPRKKCVIL